MSPARRFLPFVVLIAANAAAAGTVRVKLSIAPETPAGGVVTFKRAASVEAIEPVKVQLTADAMQVELPPASYFVNVDAPGWWMAQRLVAIRDDDTIALALKRTSTVEGEIAVADEVVPAVAIRFEDPRDASIAGEVPCAMTGRAFRCEVPERTLDLRIGAKGFVPHYRWSVPVTRERTVKAGTIALVRGASLSGRVEVEEGTPRGTRLTLAGTGKGVSVAIIPNERGFFLTGPIPPGEYALTASQKGLVSPARAVTIVEGHEAKLREPVVLSRPRSLAVMVSPPLHPYGGPWVVRLVRKDPSGSQGATIAESVAGPDGSWRTESLARGDYALAISPYGAPVWHVEDVTVHDALTWKPVAIQPVRFRGTVRLGDKPLAARVIFGGDHAPNALQFESNERGEMKGYVPAPADGRWRVTVKSDDPQVVTTLTDVEVKTDSATGIASIDLRLPATGIEAEVLAPDGKPATRAMVNVTGLPGDRPLSQFSVDENGRFALHGLPAGSYRVSATDHLAEAPVTTIEIREDMTEPVAVRLQLGTMRKWSGTIVSAEGRPIAGARIVAVPVDVETEIVLTEESNHEGRFTVLIPHAAKIADIRVAAHGFTFSTVRRVVTGDPLQLVIDPRGGTLVVDYDSRPGYEPYLWHNGAPSSVEGLISEWRGDFESFTPERRRLRIAQLEPGEYTLCLVQSQSFNYATSVPGRSCTSVYLPPFGTEVVRLTKGS